MTDAREIICFIEKHRDEIEARLLEFSATDTILYLREGVSDELILNRLKQVIDYANNFLQTSFEEVFGFDVSAINLAQRVKLKHFICKLDVASLAVVYFVAIELKSVLLGCLFLYRVFSVKDVFNLAFAEELEEQKKWGSDESINQRHEEILNKLVFWEKFCDERSLFKN